MAFQSPRLPLSGILALTMLLAVSGMTGASNDLPRYDSRSNENADLRLPIPATRDIAMRTTSTAQLNVNGTDQALAQSISQDGRNFIRSQEGVVPCSRPCTRLQDDISVYICHGSPKPQASCCINSCTPTEVQMDYTCSYYDSEGCVTTGVGHFIQKLSLASRNEVPPPLSPADSESQFDSDVQRFVDLVNNKLAAGSAPVSLTQDGFDGLVDFCYNTGCGASRSALAQLAAGNVPTDMLSPRFRNIARLSTDYARVMGKPLPDTFDDGSPCYGLDEQGNARDGVCTANGASACQGLPDCVVIRKRCPYGPASVLCVSTSLSVPVA